MNMYSIFYFSMFLCLSEYVMLHKSHIISPFPDFTKLQFSSLAVGAVTAYSDHSEGGAREWRPQRWEFYLIGN